MPGYVFMNAVAEFFRVKRLFVWVIVAIAMYFAALAYLRVSGSDSPGDSYSMISSLMLFRLLPLASAIFSSAVLSQEIEQKTIVYLLTRPIPRPVFLIMRTLASALVVFIMVTLSAITLSAAVYKGVGLTNPYLIKDVIAIAVGAVAYGSLFVLFSLVVNRSMIWCLLFAFAWETSVPSMGGSIYLLSISSYLSAIAQRPLAEAATSGGPLSAMANALGTNDLRAITGWTVMTGLILFCGVVSVLWFQTHEYLPREDAE